VEVLSNSDHIVQFKGVYKGKMIIDVFLFNLPSVTYFLKSKERRF